MDREISFLRDILLHPRMDFDEQKNVSCHRVTCNNCARYFSFFFFPTFQDTSNFTNFEIILRSKDCVKIDFQILEEVEIFLEAIFFKKINLIARFLDF